MIRHSMVKHSIGLILMLGVFFMTPYAGAANADTIQKRIDAQKTQIKEGVKLNQLTKDEVKQLNKEHDAIKKTLRKMNEDKKLDKKEIKKLRKDLDKTDQKIYRLRYNDKRK